METSRQVKNIHGKILGYIWMDKQTGDERATDFYGKILGFYSKSQDMTRDFRGRMITTGNTLVSLIMDSVK